MRRIPFVLLVAGLVVGLAVPFLWASRAPLPLGAALLAAAGLATRRPLPALGGIVAAVALLLVPGFVDDWRNGRGIAWTVPHGEDIVLAEAGVAITEDDEEPVLRARDIDSGEEKWRLRLPEAPDRGNLRIWRAGRTLLTEGFDDRLRGIDLDRGRVRWEAPSAQTGLVGVSDGRYVAMTRCASAGACQVESLSLQDGKVAWRAPVSGAGEFLGVPFSDDNQTDDRPLWPATFVVIPGKPGDERGYVARDLATGRVLAHGSHRSESTGMLGDVLVRATYEGVVTATDVRSGRELFKRPADGLQPARSALVSTGTVAMPEGSLLLGPDDYSIDSVKLGDALRLLDPRTGKVTVRRTGLPPDIVTVYATDRPAPAGAKLRSPAILWNDYNDSAGDESEVVADGRSYPRLRVRSIALTAAQLGFESTQHPWGSGERRVIEVYDRASGERRVRFVGDDIAVNAVGDRLVVGEGDREDPVVHVIKG